MERTHVQVVVPQHEQPRYRGRKGIPTQNILAVCDFEMRFTFVSAGWEGSAHDTRIFSETLERPHLRFTYPPPGLFLPTLMHAIFTLFIFSNLIDLILAYWFQGNII